MKRLAFIGIYWILLFLSKDHEVVSLTCEMDTSRLRDIFFCPTAQETFPEWCHCNNSKVDLSKSGIIGAVERSRLSFYFGNGQAAKASRCAGEQRGKVCLCPAGLTGEEERKCRMCQTDGVSQMLCLTVDEYNHVIANDQNTNESGCNITELCRDECVGICNPTRMETLPPPVRPNMTRTTVKVTTERTVVPEEQKIDSIFLFVGIGAAVLIVILFGALIYCCRKSKDVEKKESPYEAVYSTIDDGSLQNGNALRLHIYPNQVYDTRVEGPPVPPTRHEIPPHHKSLPALNAGICIPSGFSESAYQPTFPHQQMAWTNNPALYRYPSTDDVTGYKSYFQSQVEPQTGQYMYLKKPAVQPTQILPSGTVDMAPEDMKEFLNLSAGGRPGYKEQAVLSVTMDDDAYTRLNRDPRSLPAEGNRREHDNSRQHATYGFERRNHSSRGKGFKPVPAKRGAYRSKGDVTQASSSVQTETGNCSSSDSDYEGNQTGSSPYYFKMKVPSVEEKSETEPMMNNSDYQKLADTETSKPAKKKSSKRRPKSRSRRVRRRPTAEVKGEAAPSDEDDVSSQGEYTDDDIEEGLTKMNENLTDDLQTDKANIDFEDSDYHSPELLSG
ncbi:hypothetical protein HOLleu_20713 [Holothuria leucospilota]|uniref:Uncharacterized protein n=1 Tax=Holothuria leucospilota TaxID=206669 RepID=A0A9Q1C1F4_HOLLE|nr:hypothetical protein HOLleu_20713 [Holothuria leucospilota]